MSGLPRFRPSFALLQCAEQAAVRTAPTGHQVIAGNRRIAARLAAGDVVEVGRVTRRHILRVDRRIDKPDRSQAAGRQLLVHQRNIRRPHRSREARAAILVR